MARAMASPFDLAKTQTIEAKASEVAFRRDLFRYRLLNEPLFDDEFGREIMVSIFKRNMIETVRDLTYLPEWTSVRHCLEVGAECCQRAAAVVARLGVPCYAADISIESLQSISDYSSDLNISTLPKRVCCDITLIPFASRSFDLVFSYQTLHHFFDPMPVLKEIRRVTRCVYVGVEEPTKRWMQWPIGYKRRGMYHKSELGKNDVRKFVEEIFMQRCCNEIRYGVIENEKISLAMWKQMLESLFECEWFNGRAILDANKMRFDSLGRLMWLFTGFLAGSLISWIGRVPNHAQPAEKNSPVLICPDCLMQSRTELPLRQRGRLLSCDVCQAIYPVIDDVTVLLPSQLRRRLYSA